MIEWDTIGKLWVIFLGLTLVFEIYKKIIEEIRK